VLERERTVRLGRRRGDIVVIGARRSMNLDSCVEFVSSNKERIRRRDDWANHRMERFRGNGRDSVAGSGPDGAGEASGPPQFGWASRTGGDNRTMTAPRERIRERRHPRCNSQPSAVAGSGHEHRPDRGHRRLRKRSIQNFATLSSGRSFNPAHSCHRNSVGTAPLGFSVSTISRQLS